MNINELREQLNSIEPEIQRLNAQINQLETERKTREQSQLRMVGEEPKPVPKSPEQVNLEQERDYLVAVKNRTVAVLGSYNQMKAQASISEYNGYTIEDFSKMLNDFDTKRKELGAQVQVLETERKTKEQSQLRMVGEEPKPVPKSEEQVNLEREKLTYEQSFQKMANIISLYNRVKGNIDDLKNETDSLKRVKEIENIIYQANRAGLPMQLIANLLDNQAVVRNVATAGQEQPQQVQQQNNQVPNVVPQNVTQTQNSEQETVSKGKSREQEIYDLLDESAKTLQTAMQNGDDNEIAVQRSYRQQLLNELNEIKEEEKRKANEAEIAKYEQELQETSVRLQKAMEENNENEIAVQRSYRQQLLNKIAELKGVKLNEPVKVATSTNEEPITPITDEVSTDDSSSTSEETNETETVTEEPENVTETTSETVTEPEVENTEEPEEVEDEYSQLNDEEIREKIKEIKAKRKEIDDQIIKIDLNAPWEPDYDLMKEFILLGQEQKKLESYLPNEMENNNEQEETIEVEEEMDNTRDAEAQETTDEMENEPEAEENTVPEFPEQKASRLPKFKKFFKEVIPNTLMKMGYSIRKLVSKVTDRNNDGNLYISEELTDNNAVNENTGNEENVDDTVSQTEEVVEDEERTTDFTQNRETPTTEEKNTQERANLEKLAEILKGFKKDVDEALLKKENGRKL